MRKHDDEVCLLASVLDALVEGQKEYAKEYSVPSEFLYSESSLREKAVKIAIAAKNIVFSKEPVYSFNELICAIGLGEYSQAAHDVYLILQDVYSGPPNEEYEHLSQICLLQK